MNRKLFGVFKILAHTSFLIGISSLIIGLLASTVYRPASARIGGPFSGPNDVDTNWCAPNPIFIDFDQPFEYDGDQIITSVWVKTNNDNNQCIEFTVDATIDCYRVVGIGTSNVRAREVNNGQRCPNIRHVEFISGAAPSPTPQEPPSATPTFTLVPPSETPTNTMVPTTETPTNTLMPPTATDTQAPPTSTPTFTSTPPGQEPPTATNTSAPPTATNTSAPPTATNTAPPPTNTSVPPTATNTSIPPTAIITAIPPTATNTNVPPSSTNTALPPTSTNTSAPPTATNTGVPPTATSTSTPPAAAQLPTSTNTALPPTATNTSAPPTATSTSTLSSAAGTATSAAQGTIQPPGTVQAPTPVPGATGTPALIPQTGADFIITAELAYYQRIFYGLGFGLIGLGLVFWGIANKLETDGKDKSKK